MPKGIIVFFLVFGLTVTFKEVKAQDGYAGERIIYDVEPFGRSEYYDEGKVELRGRQVDLVTFRTQVFGFDDTEKIYTDPETFLPLRVERFITMWLGKEYLVEEYDPKKYSLVIAKFRDKERRKKTEGYNFKSDGPIHNGVLLPFYLRRVPKLNIGWSFQARFPEKFLVKLVSIEEIKIPAGKFLAYHFVSTPERFEIWISKDDLRLPLKIQGKGGLGYTLLMRERTLTPGKDEAKK